MSIFNLITQNQDLDSKIVAGLERLSQVFKTLLWEKAKAHGLSPIQIQILIFLQYHSIEKSTVSYLAKEFSVTKPTISDAIKILEQKQLIGKFPDGKDSRSYIIQLTDAGKNIVMETEDFPDPLTNFFGTTKQEEKEVIWNNISDLILRLNKADIINVQRTCYNCRYYSYDGEEHFCNLLNIMLEKKHIRIDCPEFELSAQS